MTRQSNLIQQHHHCHFNQFQAISSHSFQPVIAIYSHFQPCTAIPAISCHFKLVLAIFNLLQLYPAKLGHAIHFQPIISISGNSNHFQSSTAISNYLKPFTAFPSHPIIFQSFPAISSHNQPYQTFQPCTAISAISCHFKLVLAIFNLVQLYPAIFGHYIHFQPFPAINIHIW